MFSIGFTIVVLQIIIEKRSLREDITEKNIDKSRRYKGFMYSDEELGFTRKSVLDVIIC